MTDDPQARPLQDAFRRILRNAGSILLGSAGGEVLTTYAVALCALSLGPAGFGSYSEALAFVEPFDAFAVFGMAHVAMTVAAQRGGADGALRGTVLGVRFSFAVVAVALTLLIALATGRGALLPQIALVCGVTLLLPLQMASLLPFQFQQSMHRLLVVPFLASVVRVATTLAAARVLNTPVGFQLSTTLGVGALVAMQALVARRYHPDKLRFDPKLALALLALSWPAAVESFLVTLYSRGNYFFLHDVGGDAPGQYAAADRLVKPVLVVASALFVSSLPTVATLASEKSYGLLRKLFLQSFLRIGQVLVPLLGLAWYFTPWLLERFAPAYAGAVWPFRVLSAGAAFMLMNNLSTTYLISLGQFRAIMAVAFINLFVYLLLAKTLIPAHGAVGAAAATTLMEGVNALMQASVVLFLLRGARQRLLAAEAARGSGAGGAGSQLKPRALGSRPTKPTSAGALWFDLGPPVGPGRRCPRPAARWGREGH